MKRKFFLAEPVLVLLHGSTAWTLTRCLEKNVDENYTWMIRAVLKKALETAPDKTVVVRLLTAHHKKCPIIEQYTLSPDVEVRTNS